jgi:hypothetical protein
VGVPARLVLFTAIGALLAVSSSAAGSSGRVPLTISIVGSGTVKLSTGTQFTCAKSCKHTVTVPARERLKLVGHPAERWKLDAWTGACRSRAATCTLRPSHAARARALFVAPGTRKNPIPLGTQACIDEGLATAGPLCGLWGLKVLSSYRQGVRDLVVQLSASVGEGSSSLWLFQLHANIFIAGRTSEYSLTWGDHCTPPAPDFLKLGAPGL